MAFLMHFSRTRNMRMWFAAIGISLFVGFVFIAANLVPRVHYSISTYPYPGSGMPTITAGELEWGWPQVAKKDIVVEYNAVTDQPRGPRYSLAHFFGRGRRKLTESRFSMSAGLSNLAVLVSGVLLLLILVRAMGRRRFTLKAMLFATTTIAVMVTVFVRDDPLAAWDPLFLDGW